MSALKKVMATVLALGVFMPAFAFAQTTSTTSASVQATLTQIQALETQIKALQAQHEALMAQYRLLAQQQNAALVSLIQTLREGSSGDQVATLQALLAIDSSIYPEGRVSGYFGRLTAEAVKRFQKKHGIDSLGVVGPKTLKKLNELLREQDEDDDDDEDDDHRGKGREKVTICHKGRTITVAMPSVFAHLKHGDTRNACGTTSDVIAPIISAINVSGVSSTTATISWQTNEAATSKIYYGTTTPVSLGSALTVSNNSLVNSHIVGLSGLASSTTYYYVLESKDASLNTATTSTQSFVTTAS